MLFRFSATILCFACKCHAQITFRDVTNEVSLRVPLAGLLGHGGAWADVDGQINLFVGGFADRPGEDCAPELMDLSGESQNNLDSYGVNPGESSFASNCLLARRLIERGSRFLELYHATLHHLLGFDHEQLTYRFQGRDFRLTDVHGKIVKEILA